jgi:alkaline phosphatase
MGLSQITAGMYARGNTSVFERFDQVSFQKCHAADSLVTDSAASATAIACGQKTKNRMVGMTADSLPLKSILIEAAEHGKRTGMVVSSTIVHATPASFVSNTPSRYNYEDIAADLLHSDIDFFVGGGKKYFDYREDDRNVYAELQEKGYLISDYFKEELEEISIPDSVKFGYFSAFDSPLQVDQGRDYLPLASKLAVSHLDNEEEGYFLMIEGSQIDWGGHDKILQYVLDELNEFESIIDFVLDYAETDGETLVIVTGDHETGGLTIHSDSTFDSLSVSFSTIHHNGILIPVFSYGPGSTLFNGIYDNTEIYHKMRQAYHWDDMP